jgi:hypothetical protein
MLRLVSGDELGFVRVLQQAAAEAPLQQVARWGEASRARGVERLALAEGDHVGASSLLAGVLPRCHVFRPLG